MPPLANVKLNHITDLDILGEFLTRATEEVRKEVIPSVGLRLLLNKKYPEHVLNDHPVGKELLLIASKKDISLEAVWISHLCEIIVIYCLQKNLTLINEDFEELAEKIVNLFPAECIQTFYVPPVKKKNSLRQVSQISKGKLVDKYRNTLTTIRSLRKVADVSNDCMELDENQDNSQDPALESKKWLKHHRDEVQVILHWKSSYQLRRTEVLSNKYLSATDILNDWPMLKEFVCAELINTDFEQTYTCQVGNFNECWNNTFLQLKKFFFNK
ncbi:Protein of unknown function [Cotesia congregata]|uniref:Uncharacterized protein n=1 Tax=Cotesia congregata TaxID=51543 RepID=A0A8J2HI77_COTCN|nr:Protein of unknown function [Cotesia congregata]